MEKVNRSQYWLPASFTALLLGSLWFGQLFRLDLFSKSAGGVLVSDVVMAVLAVVAVILLARKKLKLPKDWLLPLWLIWFALLLLTFFANVGLHGRSEQLIGAAYLVRLAFLMAMLPLAVALYNQAWKRDLLLRFLAMATGGLLVLAGVIFIVLPDFSVLVPLGWDPHVGRLTSTWLDPNYFGSFLALVFAFWLAFETKVKNAHRVWYWLALLLIWGGLYLTFSRSALVTFAVAGLITGLPTSWRTTLAVVVLTAAVFLLPSRFQSRVTEGIAFVGGSGGSTAQSAQDPTANARLASWQRALEVYRLRPVTGVGYNFYQFAQIEAGNFSTEEVAHNRSAAGSDSSLLTLLATTGVLGLAAYLAIFLRLLAVYWRVRKQTVWAVAGIGVMAALGVSALFNNTALYSHIAIPAFLLLGAAYATALPKKGEE